MADAAATRRLSADSVRFLALEGGGGRGFAFLGALEALEELGIIAHLPPPTPTEGRAPIRWMPADVPAGRRLSLSDSIEGVSGTSAGAITALLVASGYSSADIGSIMLSYDFDRFFEPPRPRVVPRISIDRGARDYSGAEPVQSGPRSSEALRDLRRRLQLALLTAPLRIETEDKVDIVLEMHWRRLLRRLPGIVQGIATLTAQTLPKAAQVMLRDPDDFTDFVAFLPEDLGIFPGYEARKFFAELIAYKMPLLDGRPQYNASFADHYTWFGVKLAITGTNLETGQSGIFSADTTPNFPVADAVRISMSLPLAYKPLVIRQEHLRGLLPAWVEGVWVDGGYLNNIPLRAFDREGGIDHTLGLRLASGPERVAVGNIWQMLGVWPFKFGIFGAGEAHVGPGTRTDTEVIDLQTGGLSLFDFSPPPAVRDEVRQSSRDAVLAYFTPAEGAPGT